MESVDALMINGYNSILVSLISYLAAQKPTLGQYKEAASLT